MGKRINDKLHAQTGASITFALLIFLVCAVVSSVVLVAATTAAGRMSQAAQMDQKYYAVMSAAELMKSEIDGQSLVVTKTTTEVITSDKTEESSSIDLSEEDSKTSFIKDAAYQLSQSETTYPVTRAVTINGDSDKLSSLPEVKVDETISSDGKIVMRIYNNDTDKYIIELVFHCDRVESAGDVDEAIEYNADKTAITQITRTTTSILTYKWTFESMNVL